MFPYSALLRMGFAKLPTSPPELVSPYLTLSPLPAFALRASAGGFLSVALSLGSPPVPVKNHPVLRSPDFPPPVKAGGDHLFFFGRTGSDQDCGSI